MNAQNLNHIIKCNVSTPKEFKKENQTEETKKIEQRKESQNTHTQTKQGHVTLSTELQFTALMLNLLH